MSDLRRTQYRDDSKLRHRHDLHRRFSTNPLGWHRFVFDQLGLEAGESILELGCGSGALWWENADRLDPDLAPIVSDFSAGMAASARARLRTVTAIISRR